MFDFYWKQIYLEGGFLFSLVSKPVSAPEDLRGFLMRVQRTSVESISMEWFDVDRDDHARKAQEGGELGIRIARGARGWEVVYTAFLTDISLRIMTRGGGCLFGPFASAPRPLWRIRILKGSHITWPVVGEGRVATPPN
jgi:hypothetical protein